MPTHSAPGRLEKLVFSLLLATLLGALGCASNNQPDPREDIESAIRDFHGLVMWGMYEQAAGYLPPDQRGEFIGFYEALGDDIEFTEYELGAFDVDTEAEEVHVHVTYSWYRVPQYTIQETRVRETWRLDPETDHWVLSERNEAQ